MNSNAMPSDVVEELESILDHNRNGRNCHQHAIAGRLPSSQTGKVPETSPNRFHIACIPPVGTVTPLDDTIQPAAPDETVNYFQFLHTFNIENFLNTESLEPGALDPLPGPPQMEEGRMKENEGEEIPGAISNEWGSRTLRTSHHSAQTPHETVQEAQHQIKLQIPRDTLGSARAAGVPENLASNSIECRECQTTFVNFPAFQLHIDECHSEQNVQSGQDFYKCSECQDVFANKQNLDRHIAGHLGTYECDECAVRYSSKRALTMHKRKRHDKAEMPQPGPSDIDPSAQFVPCPSRLVAGLGVIRRIAKPRKTKRARGAFFCPFCKKKDKWKGNLQRHIDLVHKKVRIFDCNECSMRFGTKQGLQIHHINHHR